MFKQLNHGQFYIQFMIEQLRLHLKFVVWSTFVQKKGKFYRRVKSSDHVNLTCLDIKIKKFQ